MSTEVPNPPRILIVEDEAITAMDLAAELRGLGYEVCGTEDTAEGAVEAVEREKPSLVLMDIRLGDGGDGVEVARHITSRHAASVVFLTAHSDEDTLSRALAVSPYGYIVKPFRARELKVAVELALTKSASEQAETRKMSDLILTDPLTALGNRRRFDQALASEWNRAAREKYPLGVLIIDIDHFKAFNDTRGHAAGDECLKAVAGALQKHCTRPGDVVCRWGGEEFTVILPGADAAGSAYVAGELVRVVQELGLEHGASDTAPVVTISAGAASGRPAAEGSATALLEKADAALYAAKQAGRNRAMEAEEKHELET